MGLTKDPIHAAEIEAKIEALFLEDNFYFYNAKGDKVEEEKEIKRLISDCLSSKKCFVKQGQLEPIHH